MQTGYAVVLTMKYYGDFVNLIKAVPAPEYLILRDEAVYMLEEASCNSSNQAAYKLAEASHRNGGRDMLDFIKILMVKGTQVIVDSEALIRYDLSERVRLGKRCSADEIEERLKLVCEVRCP